MHDPVTCKEVRSLLCNIAGWVLGGNICCTPRSLPGCLQGRAGNPALGRSEPEQLFREHCVHLGDTAAADFKRLLADKLGPLVPGDRAAPLPPALQGWRAAEALLQDDRRFSAMPRSDRCTPGHCQLWLPVGTEAVNGVEAVAGTRPCYEMSS